MWAMQTMLSRRRFDENVVSIDKRRIGNASDSYPQPFLLGVRILDEKVVSWFVLDGLMTLRWIGLDWEQAPEVGRLVIP